MLKLTHCEALTAIRTMSGIDTVFMDPPDNINLGYNTYDDNLEEEEYKKFLKEILIGSAQMAPTVYMSFNAKWMNWIGELGGLIDKGPYVTRWLVQGFTFGQDRKTHFKNNFRPIFMVQREGAPLFPQKIESDRMKQGDSRAHPGGCVRGDVWLPNFLEYARVTGNSKQRRKWHPTQLHEGLVEDLLLMTTPEGGSVLDPFAGTGTTLRVCKANGWNCYTSDYDLDYCRKIAEENGLTQFEGHYIWSDECRTTTELGGETS